MVRNQRRTHTPGARLDGLRHEPRHPRNPRGRKKQSLAQHKSRTDPLHPADRQYGRLRILLRAEHHRIQRRSLLQRLRERNPLFRWHERNRHRPANPLRGTRLRASRTVPRHPHRRRGIQRREPALAQGRADPAPRPAHLHPHGRGTRLHRRQQLHLFQPAGRARRAVGRKYGTLLVHRPPDGIPRTPRPLPQQHLRRGQPRLHAPDTHPPGMVRLHPRADTLRTHCPAGNRRRDPLLPDAIPPQESGTPATTRNTPPRRDLRLENELRDERHPGADRAPDDDLGALPADPHPCGGRRICPPPRRDDPPERLPAPRPDLHAPRIPGQCPRDGSSGKYRTGLDVGTREQRRRDLHRLCRQQQHPLRDRHRTRPGVAHRPRRNLDDSQHPADECLQAYALQRHRQAHDPQRRRRAAHHRRKQQRRGQPRGY